MSTTFGERLLGVFEASGHLCVGIDPHPYLLQQWDLPDSGKGLREFGLRCVEAALGQVGILKPQVAFFERHGSAGYEALESTLASARGAGLMVIADAKRGDLGTSVEAYAQAWLTPGAPLEADAMTVSAFQGVGSLTAPMLLAREYGKGLFVLAATSNPESHATQTAIVGSGENSTRTVAASIVAEVNMSNEAPLGSFGVVIGATVRLADFGLTDGDLATTPILAPGFGFQGAAFDSLRATYGGAAANTVVSSSRGILEAGPDGIRGAIAAQVAELARAFAQ
ncbi:MAG: orotidine-5-phosphate decarboxylase [Actinomycetota bacterium]|jgi:orotidine-5'-phosphate decarboxylase|nr:orotidine-5-phosphate decarboxylase [Actinomycetota bacterium]